MPRNRVQHQKGLSDDAFERLYPDEEACRKAWFAWRWPEGFKCPRGTVKLANFEIELGNNLASEPGNRTLSHPWAARL